MKGAQRATCGQRVEGSETLRALSEFCQEGCVQRSRPPAALTRGPVCHGGGYEWGVPRSDTEGSPPCGRQAASRLSPARPCTSRGLCLTCGPCKQRLPSSPKASPEGEVHGPAPPPAPPRSVLRRPQICPAWATRVHLCLLWSGRSAACSAARGPARQGERDSGVCSPSPYSPPLPNSHRKTHLKRK